MLIKCNQMMERVLEDELKRIEREREVRETYMRNFVENVRQTCEKMNGNKNCMERLLRET